MNINEHPAYKAIYELCLEIEKLPASEQQTKVVIMAGDLNQIIKPMVDRLSTPTPQPTDAEKCKVHKGYDPTCPECQFGIAKTPAPVTQNKQEDDFYARAEVAVAKFCPH
jgi:hypothetical protein